jgi:tRNA(fMet)-specific endonuclease VapC
MRYLLDTNIVSDLMRNPQGRVPSHVRRVGEANICTSIIVAAELRFGVAKNGSPRLAERLETVLSALHVFPFEAPADVRYGEVRWRLEKSGTPIGGNDMLLAAHALSLNCTLVTDNLRELSRVRGLRCVNWLR